METLALPLIGLGAVILVVVALIWIMERRPPSRAAPATSPGVPTVPTFRVVALGLEGAGKTVLLASQFHKLSEPVADRRYFLDGDFAQDGYLARIYASVRDTAAPWPAGTHIGDTREFLFDCKVLDGLHRECTVFRISYLDYAGDRLETRDEDATAKGDLAARVDDAHALLLIVDGRRVLQLLRDEPDGHDYFDRRLRPLLGLARRATCPIQLIITKWDLVRSFGEAQEDDGLLRLVRDRLTSYGNIKALVQVHGERQGEVRLIPVSAVGTEFATLGANGTVRKREDGRLDPLHVDVPLCAVLPDVLKRVERSLDRPTRGALDEEVGRPRRGDAATIAAAVLNSRVGAVLRKAAGGFVGDEVVKLFVEMLVRRGPREAEPPHDDEAQTQRLRTEVIDHMERVVLLCEARLPSSILSRW